MAEAVSLAQRSDVAIVVAGLPMNGSQRALTASTWNYRADKMN